MNYQTCDICGRLLTPSPNGWPTMNDHLRSIRIIFRTSGGEKYADLCTKCEKRMVKYVRKEAKKDLEG